MMAEQQDDKKQAVGREEGQERRTERGEGAAE